MRDYGSTDCVTSYGGKCVDELTCTGITLDQASGCPAETKCCQPKPPKDPYAKIRASDVINEVWKSAGEATIGRRKRRPRRRSKYAGCTREERAAKKVCGDRLKYLVAQGCAMDRIQARLPCGKYRKKLLAQGCTEKQPM